MRMTNKIMQNNSLYNINQNKLLQDKLSTQMSTQKKLTRPSDDPVVAIRALRLRSSVSELTQFYEKNAPDADSWLKVTSDGLGTVTSILTDLSKNANKGANKDLTADDLDIIVTQMKSLSEEFYATGNLDYAGRYVFTGYRTDTPLSFTASDVANMDDPIPTYIITEQLGRSSFDTMNYTKIGNLAGLTPTNFDNGSHDENELGIVNADIHRLRLAYNKVENIGTSIEIYKVTGYDSDGNANTTEIPPAAGTAVIEVATSASDAYEAVMTANSNGEEKAFFIKDTGEMIFSNEFFASYIEGNVGDNDEIRVEYRKSEWENGDLRPEHYFACESTNTSPWTEYNSEYLTSTGKQKQVIAYDVGYNQTIEINTTADEVFQHGLARDVEDIESALKDLKNIDEIRSNLKTLLADAEAKNDGTAQAVKLQYDAADKAYIYIREKMHDMMQGAITKMQKYLDDSNVAVTDNGTRSSRLELITNRLMEQKTTFRTLQSENEDVDIADVAISLTSAELTYNSSLMATGKIMQTSLMNYI